MRRAGPAIALAVVALSVAVGASYYYASHNGSSSDHFQCIDPDSISSHVYNPYRLQIIKSCITASGVVDNILQEADGDYHLRLALDSQYSNLTNAGNQHQYNDLVVEIICALPITQSDAVSACQNYTKQHHDSQHQRPYHSHRTLRLRHESLQLGRNPPSLYTHYILDFSLPQRWLECTTEKVIFGTGGYDAVVFFIAPTSSKLTSTLTSICGTQTR